MGNKIDTDNFWNAFHESVGPSTSEALDNDTKKLGIPAVRFITEDWKSLIEEIRKEARREALKEMDEAHVQSESAAGLAPDMFMVEKLRQEYSNQP